MYQEFAVSTIDTDIRVKTITINFSHDIDPASIDDSTIQIINRKTRDLMDYHFEVNGKAISIKLMEWPFPNQEYILKVEKLKNILGDTLVSGIRKKIIFESSLCSTIEIIKPAFNEVVDEIIVQWKEIKQDPKQDYVNSYYVEISSEANFYNIAYESIITDQDTIKFPSPKKGQYFVRCRVQKDDQYGFWSETITFLIDNTPAEPETIFDPEEDIDEPIFLEDIHIVTSPRNGETPKSILIEFDCEIDSDFLDNIVIIRRDY